MKNEKLFYNALRIRLVEERLAAIYPSDYIQSPIHLSIGEEHISVGICSALNPTDLVFGTYRGHALYLAKGGDLNAFMAELYGKKQGCTGGKGGSMHLCAPTVGMMGASAIVASTIPHAVGAALAAKIRKSGQITACFFGEGASGEGVYHESLNFAARHHLPVLFICENNDLAIFNRVSGLHSYSIAEHARSYGIPSIFMSNGCDLDAIYQVACGVCKDLREERGPVLIEICTYRYRQHVGPNEDYQVGYRLREELDKWLERDPLVQDKALIEKYSEHIEKEIDAAVAYAEASTFPPEKDLLQDVW